MLVYVVASSKCFDQHNFDIVHDELKISTNVNELYN